MASPPDIDTPFRRLAKDRLPSPLAERFDPRAWEEAFSVASDPTQDDRNLFRAALWIGVKAQTLYASRSVRFPGIGPAKAVTLAIATLNQQSRILSANAKAAIMEAAAGGALTLDYASNVRFTNAHGQKMSIGDFVEPFIDALDAWLFDAVRTPLVSDTTSLDLESMIEPLVRFYGTRHVLKRLYDKALHLGHFMDERGIWVPLDRSMASLHQAWQARSQAVFDAAPAQLYSAWGRLDKSRRQALGFKRSVTGARRAGHGVRLKVEHLRYLSTRAPRQVLARTGVQYSYLAEFLHQPMPLAPDLTAALIDDAWWVCYDSARALALARAPSRTKATMDHATPVSRQELERAIAKALAIAPEIAAQLVGFLTYSEAPRRARRETAGEGDHGWRGLWTAPLVAVPGEDLILMAPAIFEHCVPLYRIEAWLEKGGINDQGLTKATRGREQRGNQFERIYREKLTAALAENDRLPASRIAPQGIKYTEDFLHQIDLLVKLGPRLLVGELKFFLMPADPHQWARYYEKLGLAAVQARTKSSALADRPDLVAAALGISEEEASDLTVTPLVVVNSGAGFSLEVDGCRVVDATFLLDFLRSPDFATGGVLVGRTLVSEEVTTLYNSEREAAERFDAIVANPPVLTRFLDRIQWSVIDYPADDGISFRVDTAFRGNMTPSERERRRDLVPPAYRNLMVADNM
ncbi:hypothetical protein [Sphingopyxis panaciterrae]